MPALGPVRPTGGGKNYVVSPELMATMAREPLLILNLPSFDKVGAVLVHWATKDEAGRFCVVEAVVQTLLLREQLPMSAKK